jgi:UPF0755 protein
VARNRRGGKGCLIFTVSIVTICGGGGIWAKTLIDPLPKGPAQIFIFAKPRGLSAVLSEFEQKGIIKSAFAAKALGVLSGSKKKVDPGVYRVSPGMSPSEVLSALRNPIKQLVRLPEERWVARIGKLLEEKQVSKATDYVDLTNHPEKFQDSGIPFFSDSLEGFLYPDTYNFAPGVGADYVVRRQLMNFSKKTAGLGLTKENMRRTIIIASLLELEASDTNEKKMIAGVIENRLIHGMRLQIDATINYALQLWRPLTYADYSNVKSPYNTYLHKGLPPGPICSPTAKSIEAALHPIKHKFVYYITMPDGVTRFTATYPEHLVNVKLRDTMKAQAKAQKR